MRSSRSHEATARQRVGVDAWTLATRGIWSMTDELAEEIARAERGDFLGAAQDARCPIDDDVQAGADLALQDDVLAGVEILLHR